MSVISFTGVAGPAYFVHHEQHVAHVSVMLRAVGVERDIDMVPSVAVEVGRDQLAAATLINPSRSCRRWCG
jgi:hypothetical protein